MTTDQKLMLAASIALALASLNLLRVCACILFEHYYSLYKRKRKERNGQNNQCRCEPD
jgi:hypothetical protein